MAISGTPVPIISHCSGNRSANGPNASIPSGRKPEYKPVKLYRDP